MSKHFSPNRSTRRSFLRTTVIAGTGIVVAQFARPKQLLAGGSYGTSIAVSSDDAEEDRLNSVKLATPTLSLQDKVAVWVGLRFQNVDIPLGSTITSATLTLNLVTTSVAQNTAFIYGELPTSGNSLTFSTSASNISARNKTSDCTAVIVPEATGLWSISTSFPGSDAPDLKSIIQEIIDNTQVIDGVPTEVWASGNALSLLITNNSSTQRAAVEAFDQNGMHPANLEITW
jgi:hypothetical protein